jgi:hypothetical protein
MKDMNFLEINQDINMVKLTKEDYDQVTSHLVSDSLFLCGLGFMDYSLLLVIEEVNAPVSTSRNIIKSSCGTFAYHVGIIDYLQKWNFDKKVESWWKGGYKAKISAVPP